MRLALMVAGSLLCVSAPKLVAQEEPVMVQLASPPTQGGNGFYVGNRPPLQASPLIKLPIGSITPRGWVRHMLELEADGMTGHLEELSPWCKMEGSAWASPDGAGSHPWEELPYWLKGFGDLGYVLKDERICGRARQWIEGVLSSQREDGWFGPRALLTSIHGKPDLWPHMVMLNVLQSFYEATGDPRVLPFMARYFRWELNLPEEDFLVGFWAPMRAGDNMESIHWLYNRTGEEWLLQVVEKIQRRCAKWCEGIPTWHGVNLMQGFRQPAHYWLQTGDSKYLAAAEANYDTMIARYGQVPGGGIGADENCRPGYTGPRQGFETCAIVEALHSFELLETMTGNPVWADRCEEMCFNTFPPSQTADQRGLHYLTAPNQVQLDRTSKAPMIQNGGNMFAYDPYGFRCCQHNVSHGWPYYAEHLWMATQGNGVAAALYAPCEVEVRVGDGTSVRITEETDYPFGEEVQFAVHTPAPVRFPLLLRVPRWCEAAQVEVNGQVVGPTPEPSTWVSLARVWTEGDRVLLRLPMRITVRTWETNNRAVSVSRGPLTYSLKIGERWERFGGTDEWPALECFPTTPWNYGLVLNAQDPAGGFEVHRRPGPVPDQPFTPESAPLTLTAKARRIREWKLQGTMVGLLQDSPARSTEPVEEITLIPMGCARLRISAFPTVSDGPEAHTWTEPPAPPAASHCNPSDTTLALNDGLLPANSNDHSIPRMTWWDHLGTVEWVQYEWDKPREVSWAEVYWFDDTGVGRCRIPASWRLLYRGGEEWVPVAATGPYGVEKDRFNRVEFSPVQTSALRLEVQLQEKFSGGILEWRVGNGK